MKHSPDLVGNSLGLLSIFLWSASALAVTFTGNTPIFLVTALISYGNFLFYLVRWFFDRNDKPVYLCFSKKYFWVSALGISTYMLFYISAFKMAPAIEVNLINYLWPILLVLLGSLVFKIFTIGYLEVTGMILGFTGAYIILNTASFEGLNALYTTGYIFALIAAIVWAFYSVLTRFYPVDTAAMGYVYMFLSLVSLIGHFIIEQPYHPTPEEWYGIGLLMIIQFGYAGWDYAMKKGNIKLLSSFVYLIPVFSTLLLILFLNRDVSLSLWLSIFLVLSGCAFVNWNSLKKSWQFRIKSSVSEPHNS